ncbi:Acid protease [Glarea lozoyensis ATCC 20868]|uniref:Acid protease n=1 Tax=Glarea lozoyensis (strain ATCC 20868 / MF5171) TaxID=1116229 RepID=S3CIV2_GLAL2|nr:Acid protease [Glarea lozoyensis ATCC 20868]EPE26427.1 Acid protease [Glarea lozoyensis ATCC 20868]
MNFVRCSFAVSYLVSLAIAPIPPSVQSIDPRAASPNTTLTPIVVPVSQYFDGDDGEWSTIIIRVGNPEQSVRVFVSTNSPITGVVEPGGCEIEAIPRGVPDDCANSRGRTFNSNSSLSWFWQGQSTLNGGNGVGFEANLGYDFYLDYGQDTIALGFQDGPDSVRLTNQTVAAYTRPRPLYVGFFGIGTERVIYGNFGNYSGPSFFKQLAIDRKIPSLSWSYTAGARYQLAGGQYMQLIFGGYDTSRFIPNNVRFTLGADVTRDIVVGVQSILFTGTNTTPLLRSPIYAFVESTDPNIWLPMEACLLFEKAFGLTWDNSTSKYLLSDNQYNVLSKSDPKVTFRLAVSTVGGTTADITLPFRAFALRAKYPYVQNATYYFPLQRANDSSQYTLGRAFLQEAYLTVDYDRRNFTLSQCIFNQGATPDILPIYSPTTNNGSGNGTEDVSNASTRNSQGRHTTTIVASVVVSVLVIIGGVGLWLWKKRKDKKKRDSDQTPARATGPAAPVEQGPVENIDLKGYYKPELDNRGELYEVPGTIVDASDDIGPAELHGHGAAHELVGSPVERTRDSEAMYRRVSSPLPRALERKAVSAPVSPLSPPIPQSSFRQGR